MAAPATASISFRPVASALVSTSLRGGVGAREIGAVAGASVCDWALLTRCRLLRGVDIMSGRSGLARARDARPEGRDPQPRPTATRSGASMAQSAWLLARQGSPVAKRCAIITTITAFPKDVPVLQLEAVPAVKMAVGWRVWPGRGERSEHAARRGLGRRAAFGPMGGVLDQARSSVSEDRDQPRADARQRDARGEADSERKRAWPRACPSGADVRPARRPGRCALREPVNRAQEFRIGSDRAQR